MDQSHSTNFLRLQRLHIKEARRGSMADHAHMRALLDKMRRLGAPATQPAEAPAEAPKSMYDAFMDADLWETTWTGLGWRGYYERAFSARLSDKCKKYLINVAIKESVEQYTYAAVEQDIRKIIPVLTKMLNRLKAIYQYPQGRYVALSTEQEAILYGKLCNHFPAGIR